MDCNLGLQPGICIGPLPVRFYGIIIVSGIIIGGFVATREARFRGENPDRIWDALIWIAIAGIIGARLYHVFSTPAGCTETAAMCGWPWYSQHPLDALKIWNGGLGIFGALLAGGLVVLIYARRHHLALARYLDIAAPALLIGQAIGRWGNFFNQELYGFPMTMPWGIQIDAAHRLPMFADLSRFPVESTFFHPTFFYESMWDLGMGILLLLVARRWANEKSGDLFLVWGMLYGLGRFLTEFQRPDAWTISGVATAQIIGLILIVVCGVALAYRHTGPSKAQIAAQRAQQRRRQQQQRP